ncbi:MAG: HAMP domain-containing sensor histidine kinase [Anaerolineae bacterium]|nr:HAMP domain-containing sensor histidine kinase [Anaerolineae bacterium]
MSDDGGALKQAQQKAQTLLDAAKEGSIIPFRLPGQIEEIVNLLNLADEEAKFAAAEAAKSAVPVDMEEYIQEESHFVGHMIHELNTPLTSIRGYSDMLGSMGELNDMQTQFLGIVKQNSLRMQNLLHDFRNLNKIRKGTMPYNAKMDVFKNIALKIEKDLKSRVEELNRQLEMDIPQGLPMLNLDSELLGEALVKLVENGLQYSAEGTGRVTVSASGDGSMLVITISDNGIGMTEDDLKMLGTVYFRSDRDEVIAFKGNGLGIPLAYGMIELCGGTVDVESAEDEGTTFIVRVPGMV